MQIAETTHEHGVNARVYTYQADYELDQCTVTWRAQVRQADEAPRTLTGSIVISSPASALIAEQVVSDAIVRAIDQIDPQD